MLKKSIILALYVTSLSAMHLYLHNSPEWYESLASRANSGDDSAIMFIRDLQEENRQANERELLRSERGDNRTLDEQIIDKDREDGVRLALLHIENLRFQMASRAENRTRVVMQMVTDLSELSEQEDSTSLLTQEYTQSITFYINSFNKKDRRIQLLKERQRGLENLRDYDIRRLESRINEIQFEQFRCEQFFVQNFGQESNDVVACRIKVDLLQAEVDQLTDHLANYDRYFNQYHPEYEKIKEDLLELDPNLELELVKTMIESALIIDGPNEKECSVCSESNYNLNNENYMLLPQCNHAICGECLTKWAKEEKKSCPSCRTDIRSLKKLRNNHVV